MSDAEILSTFAVATVALGAGVSNGWRHQALQNHHKYCRHHGYACALLNNTAVLNGSSLWQESLPWQRARHPSWFKLPLVDWLLFSRGFQAVLTIDLDALVMNTNLSIASLVAQAEEFEQRQASVVLSSDTTLVQMAQVIYRRTDFTRALLRELWQFPDVSNVEQGAMACWLCGCHPNAPKAELRGCYDACDRGWRNHTVARLQKRAAWRSEPWAATVLQRAGGHLAWLPQRSLNSYAPIGSCADQYSSIGGADVTAYQRGDFVLHVPGVSERCRASTVARALR